MPRHAAPLLIAALSTACTPAARYEVVRESGEAKAECDRLPTAAAEAACRAEYARPYEAYEEARAEATAPEPVRDPKDTRR
jgi:hypothetical protein